MDTPPYPKHGNNNSGTAWFLQPQRAGQQQHPIHLTDSTVKEQTLSTCLLLELQLHLSDSKRTYTNAVFCPPLKTEKREGCYHTHVPHEGLLPLHAANGEHYTTRVHIITALSNYLTRSISALLIYTPRSTSFMPSDTAGTSCQNPWKMIYIFCPSLEGISLSSKYRESRTSSSAGTFALSQIETLVLPEAESQTRQCNSTNLAQVLRATATQHMFIGPLPYIFYCFLRIRFQKEQNLFQTCNKLLRVASKRKYCSGFFLKQLSLRWGDSYSQQSQAHVHGYRADPKYSLLFTTYAQKSQPKPPQGQTSLLPLS